MKKRGRPSLPDAEKKKYVKVAVYPRTRERIKANAEKANLTVVDYMDKKFKESR